MWNGERADKEAARVEGVGGGGGPSRCITFNASSPYSNL